MIVERFKELRNRKQLSQKDFALQIGVAQQTVASWEIGRTEPSNVALKNIADYFDVSTDYLLGRDRHYSCLSDMQSALLFKFDKLDDEGKNIIFSVIKRFLSVTPSEPNKFPIVQNNKHGNNYGVVSGNNVTMG